MDRETLLLVLQQLQATKETIHSRCDNPGDDATLVYWNLIELIETVEDSIKLS